jgi:hypothetical protein
MNYRTILYVDKRGYALTVDERGRYYAGCHGLWTAAKALAHWSSPGYPDHVRGDAFCNAIRRHKSGLSPNWQMPDGLVLFYAHCADLRDVVLPLPASLQKLYANRTDLRSVVLPASLQRLYANEADLRGVVLPMSLRMLSADGADLCGTVLPASLRCLYANGADLRSVVLPESLQDLYANGADLRGTALPASLRTLDANGADLRDVTIPEGCEVFR